MWVSELVGIMAYKDKQNQATFTKRWSINNRDKVIASNNVYRIKVRQQFADYKSQHGCSRCDESQPYCIELHHPDPAKKDVNPAQWISQGCSMSTILKKIKEQAIILLCANCHRKEHHRNA